MAAIFLGLNVLNESWPATGEKAFDCIKTRPMQGSQGK